MGAKEVIDRMAEMFAADTEAMALDTMLYGRCILEITQNDIRRVPPEEWHKMADDIVLPKKTET
jgi:hypothetical protein